MGVEIIHRASKSCHCQAEKKISIAQKYVVPCLVHKLRQVEIELWSALVLAHHGSVLLPQPLAFAGKIALEFLLPKRKQEWLRRSRLST